MKEQAQQPNRNLDQVVVCPVCRCPLAAEDAEARCPDCGAAYHEECWQDNGGCGIYGCSRAPTPKPPSALDSPTSHWGQEHKDCPRCSKQILAAAIRCRHCGEAFPQVGPESRSDYKQRKAAEKRLPSLKRTVIAISVFCWLPCTAPLGGAFGGLWYLARRRQLCMLPQFYRALFRIAIGAACAQTALFLVGGAIAALR